MAASDRKPMEVILSSSRRYEHIVGEQLKLEAYLEEAPMIAAFFAVVKNNMQKAQDVWGVNELREHTQYPDLLGNIKKLIQFKSIFNVQYTPNETLETNFANLIENEPNNYPVWLTDFKAFLALKNKMIEDVKKQKEEEKKKEQAFRAYINECKKVQEEISVKKREMTEQAEKGFNIRLKNAIRIPLLYDDDLIDIKIILKEINENPSEADQQLYGSLLMLQKAFETQCQEAVENIKKQLDVKLKLNLIYGNEFTKEYGEKQIQKIRDALKLDWLDYKNDFDERIQKLKNVLVGIKQEYISALKKKYEEKKVDDLINELVGLDSECNVQDLQSKIKQPIYGEIDYNTLSLRQCQRHGTKLLDNVKWLNKEIAANKEVNDFILMPNTTTDPSKKPSWFKRHPVLTGALIGVGVGLLTTTIAVGVGAALFFTGGAAAIPFLLGAAGFLVAKLTVGGAIGAVAGGGAVAATATGGGLGAVGGKVTEKVMKKKGSTATVQSKMGSSVSSIPEEIDQPLQRSTSNTDQLKDLKDIEDTLDRALNMDTQSAETLSLHKSK